MPAFPRPLKGIVPPVCTPLTESFDVDSKSLRRLIAFQLEAGVQGLFMLGSSSEIAFLTDEQRKTVLEVAVHTVAGQVPVLAGVIDMSTAPCVEHARLAQKLHADALVVTAPFYARVSQAEIIEHFRVIHSAVDLPILAYDIPPAVHVKLERETVVRLAREGLIVGIKDSSGNEADFRSLLIHPELPDHFAAFTGSELLVDIAIFMGAQGSVPGLGNVDPAGYVRLYHAAKAGDWETARREQERLFRLFAIVYAGTPGRTGWSASALGGFKTALMLLGIFETNVVGRPQTRLNDEEVARVRTHLHDAGLL